MSNTRKATNRLLDEARDGSLSWEAIARACLNYMSEADVAGMAEEEFELYPDEPEEEEEEDDDDPSLYHCDCCGYPIALAAICPHCDSPTVHHIYHQVDVN
jgi:rubrerythrin